MPHKRIFQYCELKGKSDTAHLGKSVIENLSKKPMLKEVVVHSKGTTKQVNRHQCVLFFEYIPVLI